MNVNRVLLVGRITREPELRHTSSGVPVMDLGLAMNEAYTSRDGAPTESTCFVDVIVWKRQAEVCAQYLQKGSPVCVEGKLQLDTWQSEKGEKRSRIRIRADRVQFMPIPKVETEPA